jgi:hypothetical protein
MTADPVFEAFPQIDAGSHGGDIVQLLVAPGGKMLLSAGETTVRCWSGVPPADHRESRLQRMLLGRVNGQTDDSAIDGRAERMAISRDGLWAVVLKPWRHEFAGDPTSGHDDGRVTELQVFELASGNLQGRSLWPGRLLDVDFSPDGLTLAAVGPSGAGPMRYTEVLVWATRELLRKGARRAPEPLSRHVLPGGRQAPEAALRFVPDPQAYPPPRTHTGSEATLVVAIADEADRWGEVAWLNWKRETGLAQARSLRTDVPINAATLAVSPSTVAVAAAPLGGRKLRGQLLWFAHQEGGRSGTVQLEEPAASAAFSPSGARLALGLVGAKTGEATVQVDVFDCLNPSGPTLRSTYLGHDDTVRAVAFIDEDTVASAGGDNHAIHFWRPTRRIAEAHDALRGVGRVAVAPGITADERVLFGTVPERLLPPLHALRQQSFDLRRMVLTTTATSKLRVRDFASRKWHVGYERDMVIPLWFIGDDKVPADPQARMPDLNLFVGADDTWVLWTASGYYNAGGGDGAERRIGYRVNRGLHQEALFVPSDRFKAFYDPDIVRAVVRYGSESRAIARGVAIPQQDVTHILPPIAELASEDIRKKHGSVGLSFTVESPCPGYPVTRSSLLRNGRVVWTKRETPASTAAMPPPSYGLLPEPTPPTRMRCVVPPLPLLPGRNRFAFHVENEKAKSVPLEFEIDVPAKDLGHGPSRRALEARGQLYLLSVGVAEFADPSLTRLHCSHLDAAAVVKAFAHGRLPPPSDRRGGTGNLAFDKVDAKLLVNGKATKAVILGELDRMCTEIRQRHAKVGAERDVLFVFLSGHGTPFLKKGLPTSLFFSNHDIVPTAEDVESSGLSMMDLGDRITSVPAEVVLVIDACHAALAGAGTMAGINAEELARRVQAIYERGMYLVCAARAKEIAREDAEGMLGVLTGALMEALQRARPATAAPGTASAEGKRGKPGLEVLMADIVAGVQRFVPEVSARTGVPAQTPVCRIYGDLMPLTMLKT